jgi:hypothetical protein
MDGRDSVPEIQNKVNITSPATLPESGAMPVDTVWTKLGGENTIKVLGLGSHNIESDVMEEDKNDCLYVVNKFIG